MKKILIFTLCVIMISMGICTECYAEPQYGKVYRSNPEYSKKLALTFDDGPHPKYTEEILSILEEYGVSATFFIIGVNAKNYPDTLQKIAESGCEIGNHTYSHIRVDRLNKADINAEIVKCEETIYSITGQRTRIFRPPEGFMSDTVSRTTEKLGYNIALWSIDTLDWSLNPSDKICTAVMSGVKGGDIILMHDYVSGGNTTCDALRMFIPEMLSRGYEFVTFSELIS